jgi:hypothetical protein
MLNPIDYELLIDAIERMGTKVYTSLPKYVATHYLPNWYHLMADLTPETKFYPLDDDLETELY